MKQRARRTPSFFKRLQAIVSTLQTMRPDEIHIIHVRANYGNYQIVIGPESMLEEKSRPLEINGQIHHLFVSPNNISPNPTHDQIDHHLHDTIVMRDVTIHLLDERGDGQHLVASNGWQQTVDARDAINLAGEKGKALLERTITSGELPRATYHIIQEDILQALEKNPEDLTEKMR